MRKAEKPINEFMTWNLQESAVMLVANLSSALKSTTKSTVKATRDISRLVGILWFKIYIWLLICSSAHLGLINILHE